MMHCGMRHEEAQELHVDDLHVFRLMQQGIPVKEIPKCHAYVPPVFSLRQQGILPREIPKHHADAQPVFRLMQQDIIFREVQKRRVAKPESWTRQFPFVARAIVREWHDCTWIWVMLAQ